jgi:hypothetical protein
MSFGPRGAGRPAVCSESNRRSTEVSAVNRILVHTTAAIGAACVGLVTFAAGAGAVNEYVGMTYADATAAIAQSGGSYKVATRVGSLYGQAGNDSTRLYPTEGNCRVTGSRTSPTSGVILLDLRCDYAFAIGGTAGPSRASQEGRAAYESAVAAAEEQQKQQQAEAEAAAAGEG